MKLAGAAAEKVAKRNQSDTERIDASFRAVLGRPASNAESVAAEKFLHRFRSVESKGFRKKPDVDKAAWSALVQALFASAEFRYLD
jgi:hypothetical protein